VDSEALARIYGLAPSSLSLPQFVTLDADKRAGILTRAALLSYDATPVLTLVRRGRFVRQNLLGHPIGNPPDNVNADTLTHDKNASQVSLRDRFTRATSAYSCAFCHNVLNPAGFAFGNFAPDGSEQPTETGYDKNGKPVRITIDTKVDANIDVRGRDEVKGATEFSALIGDSASARWAFVRSVYATLAGRTVDTRNACVPREMFDQAAGSPVLDLVRTFVNSPEFLQRRFAEKK
jgi:hypothetical protein